MIPLYHLISGLIVSAIAYQFYGMEVWVILASTVLLDIDHYLLYIYKFKKIWFKEAYIYFKQQQDSSKLFLFFHYWEIIFLVGILAYFSRFFQLVLIGQVLHVMLDYLESMLRGNKRNFALITYVKSR